MEKLYVGIWTNGNMNKQLNGNIDKQLQGNMDNYGNIDKLKENMDKQLHGNMDKHGQTKREHGQTTTWEHGQT